MGRGAFGGAISIFVLQLNRRLEANNKSKSCFIVTRNKNMFSEAMGFKMKNSHLLH
jgi:hypothetical protein